MKWSPTQDRALLEVNQWMQNPDKQIFRLFGYAGTGKTTLAKHFAENVSGDVRFGAYTGKAAHVLREKGCVNANTIHSMIYNTKEKGKSTLCRLEEDLLQLITELGTEDHESVNRLRKLIKVEREKLSRPSFSLNLSSNIREASLVVIDECSMVDGRMGEDLLSFGVPVLVLGDPAQLPPVGGGGFFTNAEPDVMLTEIHRQAKDNPIIDIATRIRKGEPLPLGNYGQCSIIEKQSMCKEDALNADQILVGRNKTRHTINKRIRELKGHTGELPVNGDKVVCLRNNHDLGLMNGAVWFVDDIFNISSDRVALSLKGGETVECHTQHFLGNEGELAWWERKEAEEFGYGYAMTVHKSQGSQWDNILLFDESASFRQNAREWLYTAVTRAAETIKIIR